MTRKTRKTTDTTTTTTTTTTKQEIPMTTTTTGWNNDALPTWDPSMSDPIEDHEIAKATAITRKAKVGAYVKTPRRTDQGVVWEYGRLTEWRAGGDIIAIMANETTDVLDASEAYKADKAEYAKANTRHMRHTTDLSESAESAESAESTESAEVVEVVEVVDAKVVETNLETGNEIVTLEQAMAEDAASNAKAESTDAKAESTDAKAKSKSVISTDYKNRCAKSKAASGKASVHCGDEIAAKFAGLSLATIIAISAREISKLAIAESKPDRAVTAAALAGKYDHLNPGMIRMNVVNTLRAAAKRNPNVGLNLNP